MIKIQDIIILILLILTTITVVWFIFGNSPSFEQTIMAVTIGFLFTVNMKLGGFGARLDLIERRFTKLEQSFIKLANDFKGHLTKYHKVKL